MNLWSMLATWRMIENAAIFGSLVFTLIHCILTPINESLAGNLDDEVY